MITEKTRCLRHNFSCFDEIDGEVVIMDARSEKIFGLNKSGSLFWAAMEEAFSIDDINDLSKDESNDILNFLNELDINGLIKKLPPNENPTTYKKNTLLKYGTPSIVLQKPFISPVHRNQTLTI